MSSLFFLAASADAHHGDALTQENIPWSPALFLAGGAVGVISHLPSENCRDLHLAGVSAFAATTGRIRGGGASCSAVAYARAAVLVGFVL